MNLLSLIIIVLALIVAGSIFYIAWELSSDKPHGEKKDEPDDSKES